MDKKQATALGLGGLVIGGLGAGFIADDSQDVAELQDQITALQEVIDNSALALEDKEALIAELNDSLIATQEEFEQFMEEYADAIREVEAENEAIELAKEEILDETRDAEDFLESEFGWDIEDDDDIEFRFDEVEILKSDYDDEKYMFKFTGVKVTYEDDDNDYTEYLDITVEVEEGEVEDISYEEA